MSAGYAPLVMAAVAGLAGLGAFFFMRRATTSEASVYRNRIAAAMLGAAALTLGGFAFALYSWSRAL